MKYEVQKMFSNKKKFSDLILYILDVLKKKTTGASVYISSIIGMNLNCRNYHLENLEYNSKNTITITAYHDLKKGVVVSTDLCHNNIIKVVDYLLNIIQYTSIDKFSSLPDVGLLAFTCKKIDLFYPWTFETSKLLDYSYRIEKSALNYNKLIITTENINISSYINYHFFGNSYGMLQNYKTTLHSLYSEMISKNQTSTMQRDFSYSVSRSYKDLQSPDWVGLNSAKKAANRLFSIKIKTQSCPTIISSNVVDIFFSSFIQSIRGMNVYRKTTLLYHNLNTRIFPTWLNIFENPHIHKGLSSKPFDQEGVKTQKRFIVHQGILKTWLLDTYSSRKLNLCNTGHFGNIYNWLVSGAEDISLQDLFKKMCKGLFVTEFMGNGTNIITGDYSVGIFGFWVERGIIQYPVSEITISGNLKHMWKNIISISNDIEYNNTIRCGSILLDNMQISGI